MYHGLLLLVNFNQSFERFEDLDCKYTDQAIISGDERFEVVKVEMQHYEISNNCYYFTDEIFTNKLENKGNPLALYDVEFQNQLINRDNVFNVNELVSK